MLKTRVIPCLDVKDGRVVKGVNFVDLVDAGDPVEQARVYDREGADELTFLDITASHEELADVFDGAHPAAVARPEFVREAAEKFGSQCIVVAVDAKRVADGRWEVFTHGGRRSTGIDAIGWAERMATYGAGEILLTSMDRDGTQQGFDLPLTRAVSDAVRIPVIASGGVGSLDHLVEGVRDGGASAVLAASIFHFGRFTIADAKAAMTAAGIPVRPAGRPHGH